jgi:hypothetical protein
MTLSPLPGHGPDGEREDNRPRPAPSARTTLAHLFPERRERDHGRAIFLTGLLVSTRTTGRASLNSGMGSKPVVRSSAFLSHPRGPSRAVCAGRLRGFLPPPFACRRFQFVRAVKVARHLLSVRVHSASRVCQDIARRSAEQWFHSSLSLLADVGNHDRRKRQSAVKA